MNSADFETEARGNAAGKVILLGEHAVVHGEPALAVALRRGVSAVARRNDGPLMLRADKWRLSVRADQADSPARAIRALCKELGMDPSGAVVELEPYIPPRAGLGASAAMAVAIARSLAKLFERPLPEEVLRRAVHASECVFHGTPSGLDAAVSLAGTPVLFSKAEGATPLSAPMPPLLIVHSGIPKDTATSVARFAERMKESPEESSRRIVQIGALARRGAAYLIQNDLTELGALMTENHRQLQWFDVSCAALDRIVEVSLKAGALGAKLTGGGRGGCAVVLLPPDPTPVLEAVRTSGFEEAFS